MKCVLLYSKRHFSPGTFSELNGSSAGVISRELYETLIGMPNLELHYFDAFDLSEWIDVETDILISIVDSFNLAYWYFRPKVSIVIAVNQHPLDRLLNTIEISKRRMPIDALAASDGWLQPAIGLRRANGIIFVGNQVTKQSFARYLPTIHLYQAHYSPHVYVSSKSSYPKVKRSVLVLMSSIGFRKGFDRFYESMVTDAEKLSGYTFEIVGLPEGRFWQEKIESLVKKYPNINFRGWISNLSSEFSKVLSQSEYAIFPTREEGMVGSLLECLEYKIICLHTSHSGIDNSSAKLRLPSNGPLNLFSMLNQIDIMEVANKNQLVNQQIEDWRRQVSNSRTIGSAVVDFLSKDDTKPFVPSKKFPHIYLPSIQIYFRIPVRILTRRINYFLRYSVRNRLFLGHPFIFNCLRHLKNFNT